MEGRTDFPRCLNSDELWALSSRRGGMMEAEEGRGTHERARRNDAEGGLSPFSLQGRMGMVVGRFEIVIRARSPGPYFGIYRKPIWHLRIQRLKCSSGGGRSCRRFPNTYFCFKELPPMGAQSAFRRWHERTFPTKSNSFHAAKPKEGNVFYAAAVKMQQATRRHEGPLKEEGGGRAFSLAP